MPSHSHLMYLDTVSSPVNDNVLDLVDDNDRTAYVSYSYSHSSSYWSFTMKGINNLASLSSEKQIPTLGSTSDVGGG